MADPPPGRGGDHLDATGTREVVYCHQCENEWYRDQNGLTCPRCDGEATEIISPENDPRSITDIPGRTDALRQLQNHNPWPDDHAPDPEDGDVEEYITNGPDGRTMFFSQTIRTNNPPQGMGRNTTTHRNPNDATDIMQDFHNMISTLVGPNFQQGQAGRSGPDALYPRDESNPFPPPRQAGFGFSASGPQVVGGRFTFTTGPRTRAAGNFQPSQPGDPHADDLATILGGLFGAMGPMGTAHDHDGPGQRQPVGMPPQLQGLFASLFNPANAVAGDAVYSQEALDRIISTLMEQHPTSNAPGPATSEAIASLPKKNLDEKMLGPELKAECSVCMDDVHFGDEVVVLPCTHWFHETCATAWLSEHNTCPICRTGIGSDSHTTTPSMNSLATGRISPPIIAANDPLRNHARANMPRRSSRNEARLDAIRERGRVSTATENINASSSGRQRYQIIGDGVRNNNRTPSPPGNPGGYNSGNPFRRRESDRSDRQREAIRRDTSGSDQSRGSSGSTGSAGGPMSWIRDRFTGGSRRHD